MVKKILTAEPYNSICDNLYSVDIFDKTLNGLLSVIDKKHNNQTILIERKFTDSHRVQIGAGYYFIQCLTVTCGEEQLTQYRRLLEEVVKQRARGNYMEVDPILIAPQFNSAVLTFIEQYNKIQKRKPIQLFNYGK